MLQQRPVQPLVILQLDLDQPARQFGRVDRRVHLAQEVRQAADVVLVPVCHEDGLHLLAPLDDVLVVRDDQVDAGHVELREHQP